MGDLVVKVGFFFGEVGIGGRSGDLGSRLILLSPIQG